MSSETSTEQGRSRADSPNVPAQPGMQPWQFFVLAGLGCATAVTFLARNQGLTAVLLLSMLMAATDARRHSSAARDPAARVGARRPQRGHRPAHPRGARTGEGHHAAHDQGTRIRPRDGEDVGRGLSRDVGPPSGARRRGSCKQLDAGTGYRPKIEQDLAKRLGDAADKPSPNAQRNCSRCSTSNDADARFCKNCGERLA